MGLRPGLQAEPHGDEPANLPSLARELSRTLAKGRRSVAEVKA